MKRSFHGSSIGTKQRNLRGTADQFCQPIRDSLSPSRVDLSLVEKSPIKRSHENTNDAAKENFRMEKISKSSHSSTNSRKDFDLLENGFLQEELVKAVKNHFQENFKSNKNNKKSLRNQQVNPSKSGSSDDEIEGMYLVCLDMFTRKSNIYVKNLITKNTSLLLQ